MKRPNTANVNALAICVSLGAFLAYCDGNEHPCGAIPDPFPVAQQTGNVKEYGRTLLGSADIPVSWDSRDHGWVSPVKDQGYYSTCWSFAACSVLETALLKGGYGEFDLSEKNMVLNTGWNATPNSGGNITMSGNYFTSWQGPAFEDEDPYPAYGSSNAHFGQGRMVLPKFKVMGAVRIPARSLSLLNNRSRMLEDTATMKKAIMEYGSLVVPYAYCTKSSCANRSSGATYCNEYTNSTTHLVAVVGWDDNYSKSKFKRTPPGNGAWLVKNSYGTTMDDKGYLHISYYDTTFGFAAEMGAFILASDDQDYDAVYNYARAGFCGIWGWNNTTDTIAGAAIFTAASDERLAAVGFYSLSEMTEYEIEIYTDCKQNPDSGTLAYRSDKGKATYRGYVTVPLSREVELKRGTRFSVVLKLRCPTFGYPLARAYSADWDWITVTAEAAAGQTFCKNVSQNSRWFDFTSVSSDSTSFCCAAYVREAEDNVSQYSAESGTNWDAASLTAWYAGFDNTASGRLQFGKTPGAFAQIRGMNGYSMLENYMLGFSPKSEDEHLHLSIRMQGKEPIVEWNRTNSAVSVYSILGSRDLSTWHDKAAGDRFFKLRISLP